MKKKKVIKTVTTTEVIKKKRVSHPKDKEIEKVLVENFVILQKVMTDLSIKLDKLTSNISELLEIFEKSAETLAKKDFRIEQKTEDTEKVLEGIKNLAEQNKIIARGLTLIHEHERTKEIPPQIKETIENPPFPEPRTEQAPIRKSSIELDEYEDSISSKLRKLKPLPREQNA